MNRIESGKRACNSPTVEEWVLHEAISNEIKSQINQSVLQDALLASAQLAADTDSIKAALQEMLSQRLELEYDDILARQLIQKVVVMDEERFEILFK